MNWEPFNLCKPGEHAPKPRRLTGPEGVADRMRAAAFAELQATRAFSYAAKKFDDAPQELREAWQNLAKEEQKHFDLIVGRMRELNFSMSERPVSLRLWDSLMTCQSAREFSKFITSAEERGRQAGIRLVEYLKESDPVTAKVFQFIVDEEVDHVDLDQKFFKEPVN